MARLGKELDSKARFDGFVESGMAVRFRRKNPKGHDDKHIVKIGDIFLAKSGKDPEMRRTLRELGINRDIVNETARMAKAAKLTPLH